eukprot:CFRG3296T1
MKKYFRRKSKSRERNEVDSILCKPSKHKLSTTLPVDPIPPRPTRTNRHTTTSKQVDPVPTHPLQIVTLSDTPTSPLVPTPIVTSSDDHASTPSKSLSQSFSPPRFPTHSHALTAPKKSSIDPGIVTESIISVSTPTEVAVTGDTASSPPARRVPATNNDRIPSHGHSTTEAIKQPHAAHPQLQSKSQSPSQPQSQPSQAQHSQAQARAQTGDVVFSAGIPSMAVASGPASATPNVSKILTVADTTIANESGTTALEDNSVPVATPVHKGTHTIAHPDIHTESKLYTPPIRAVVIDTPPLLTPIANPLDVQDARSPLQSLNTPEAIKSLHLLNHQSNDSKVHDCLLSDPESTSSLGTVVLGGNIEGKCVYGDSTDDLLTDTPVPISQRPSDEPRFDQSLGLKRLNSEDVVSMWSQLITCWDDDPVASRKTARAYIEYGIPDGLRGLVWPMLAGVHTSILRDEYVHSIPLESPFDKQIMKDLSRTFPEHELFKNDAVGQETLFRLMKAYALHDVESGYCQGMAFVAGVLLMKMPEEDAFAVLVTLMGDQYGLRGLFMPGVPLVGLANSQFSRLLKLHLPDVAICCEREGVDMSTFLTQWLMTLFAPNLPLPCVFHIMDYILAVGVDPTLYRGFLELFFRVALTLLKNSADKIVSLNFDGIIVHLKEEMKAQYQWINHEIDTNSPNAISTTLIHDAIQLRISHSLLVSWEKKYKEERELVENRQAMVDQNMEKKRDLQRRNDQLDLDIAALQSRVQQDADGMRDEVRKLRLQSESYEQRLERLRVHNVVMNDLVRINAEG